MTDTGFKSFGVRARQDRQQDDFYETDPFAVEKLIEKLTENHIPIPATIIDSSVGRGSIAKVFENTGRKVIGYDIVDRGWQGTILKDYRFVTERCVPKHEMIMIVENPPAKPLETLSIDERMKRVPNDLNDANVREDYIRNHVEWFLKNHPNAISDFMLEVNEKYGTKIKCSEQMNMLETFSA